MNVRDQGTKLLTFGFINNDKYNDLVTTNEDQNQISVHFFDSSSWKYDSPSTLPVFEDKSKNENVVIT